MNPRFEITVTVKWQGIVYEQLRSPEESDGCCHYENIPSMADYMGRAILEQIHKSHWLKGK